MKNILLFLMLSTITPMTLAQCYQRSEISINRQQINTQPTDIQKMVTPDALGYKCVIRYRLHIGDQWITVEGTAVSKNENSACNNALNLNNAVALEEVKPRSIKTDQQLICSDLPNIQVRPVHRGELIWESEADLHSHPLERKEPYFFWKQSQCRKFIERASRDQNLIVYQGIMCRATTADNSKWLVLDKY